MFLIDFRMSSIPRMPFINLSNDYGEMHVARTRLTIHITAADNPATHLHAEDNPATNLCIN